MRTYTRSLLVSLISLIAVSCAHRAPSERMLEKRAGYESDEERIEFYRSDMSDTRGSKAVVWVHPHKLPTGDYFHGAWVTTTVQEQKLHSEDNLIPEDELPPIKKSKPDLAKKQSGGKK